jgi:pilus assembly protein CpaE
MKIKVVSADSAHAERVAQIVRASGPGLDVHAATAQPAGLRAAINGMRPGLLVLDDVNESGLDAIGRLALEHPEIDTIIISAERSPSFLLRAMQAGVREVLPPPVDAPALQAAVRRLARKRQQQPAAPARHGDVLAFMGCKGGSGASFLAANLAHMLSMREGCSVALLDLDLQFGNALLMLSDQRGASDVAEVARNVARLDAELLRSAMVQVSDSLSVLPGPQDLSQALEVKPTHLEAIVKQARQMFDFVVLDLGRSIDAVSLQAMDMATLIFPVLQLSLPQIHNAKRLRALFRSLDYPPQKIHWLVNRYEKGGELTLESLQPMAPVGLSTIPNHFSGVMASVTQGIPIARLLRKNPVARALSDLANAVAPIERGKKDGWLSSLFATP